MRDWELRSFVRGLPPEQRTEAVRSHPELAEAVLRAPRELSGVHPTAYALLEERALEGRHGPELDAYRNELEALEATQQLAGIVLSEIERQARLSRRDRDDDQAQGDEPSQAEGAAAAPEGGSSEGTAGADPPPAAA